MKPESIKTIIRTYLKEKQHSSSYNVSPRKPPRRRRNRGFGVMMHQSSGPPQNAYDGLEFLQSQSADLPLNVHDVPPVAQLNDLAVVVGRRLGQMSREFDLNRLNAVNNQASSNGIRCIEFRENVIRVLATSDRIQIPVIRKRATDGEVNVTWRTCNKSAKAGLHYVSSHGNISFAQDDEEKTIEIEILRDQEKKTDVHFSVELLDADVIFNTLIINIVDDSRLDSKEEKFMTKMFSRTCSVSMSEIVTCLSANVTPNTFKAGLLCLCSFADSLPTKELALGAELLRLTIPNCCSEDTLNDTFCEFFSYLPEPEDIVALF